MHEHMGNTRVNLALGPIHHSQTTRYTHLLEEPALDKSMDTDSTRSKVSQVKVDEAEAASLSPAVRVTSSENWERTRKRKVRTAFTHLGVFLLVMATFVPVFVFAPLLPDYVGTTSRFINVGTCDSNGNFQTKLHQISFWSSSGAFQITLGFGSMPFDRAKAIDVAWDLVIGRCGQGLLTFISYRVFTKCLYRHMEQTSVTLDVFESFTLRDMSSPSSIFCLVKDFFTNTTTRARLSMAWIVFASIYLLFFQTLMSAMTGYSATTSPYVGLRDGTQRHWSDFRMVYYVINDASRLGLQQENYIISNMPVSGGAQFDDGCQDIVQYPSDYSEDMHNACSALFEASNYTLYYGFNGQADTQSNFSFVANSTQISKKLDSPALNISAFFLPDNYWQPRDLDRNLAFSPAREWYYDGNDRFSHASLSSAYGGNASLVRYALSGQTSGPTYDLAYLSNNGVCQQNQHYQWGFSALLLFFAMLLTAVWAVGMWAMWLDAFFQSRLDNHDRGMGNFRAVLDMAQVLQDALGDRDATEMLSDGALRRRIKESTIVCTISYQAMAREKAAQQTRLTRFKRWYRRGWKGWTGWERGFVATIPVVSCMVLATVLPSVLAPSLLGSPEAG